MSNKYIIYNEGEFEYKQVSFLIDQIKNDLFQYYSHSQLLTLVEKWNISAKVCVCLNNGEVAGIAVFYANDPKNKGAFIALVATAIKFRGLGIGNKLISKVKEFCRANDFQSIGLETYNSELVNWYRKHCFKLISHVKKKEREIIKDSYLMSYRI